MSRVFADDKRALILGLDSAPTLGPVGNLLEMRKYLAYALKSGPDAIVVNKGQLIRPGELITGSRETAVILRADFTNAMRGADFTLPPKKLEHVMLAGAKEALTLGADGVAASLLVGYEDEEARSVKIVSSLVADCKRYGVVILVEAVPIGERITSANYVDCLKLAVRMATEAGADIVAMPYAGDEPTTRSIVEAAGQTPVLAIDDPRRSLRELGEAMSAGCSGLVLRDRLASGPLEEVVSEAKLLVHGC